MNKIEGIQRLNKSPHEFKAMNRSFDVNNAGEKAAISIYEEIGYWGVTAAAMRYELSQISAGEIDIIINSPGGDVFDGISIYNDLVDHPAKINVKITGMAASAASIIAMAGDTIEMKDNAFIMIHNAWSVVMGDKSDMDASAGILSKIDNALIKTYKAKTGHQESQLAEWMDAETWFTAEDAKENGFIDSISGEENAKAVFDLSVYSNVPANLKRQIEAKLRDEGYSQKEAKTAIKQGFQQRDAGGKHRDGEKGKDINVLAGLADKIKNLKI